MNCRVIAMSSSDSTEALIQRKLQELQGLPQWHSPRTSEPLCSIVATLSQATIQYASANGSERSAKLCLPAFSPKGHSTTLSIDTYSEQHYDVDTTQTMLKAWWRLKWVDAPAALKPADVQLLDPVPAGEPEPSVLITTLLECDHSGFPNQQPEASEDEEARIVAVALWLVHAGVLECAEEWEEIVHAPPTRTPGSPAFDRVCAGARLTQLLFEVVQVDYSFCLLLDGQFVWSSKYLKPTPTSWWSGAARDQDSNEEDESEDEAEDQEEEGKAEE